ncbi:hypothetical protein V3C99_016820 [Haemonchus contortus]|uniref:DUF4200 domain-containing protein n=1 Tax=Haemonchus contortus TaxID=6289 RepID=A0A7I4YXT6_HAECO
MSDDAFFDPERPRLCKATVTYHSNLQFQDRLSYIDKRYDHLRRLTQTLKRKINDLEDIMRQDNDEENMEQIKALIEDIKREKQLMRDEAHIIRGELSQAMYNEDLRSHLLNFIAEFEDTWQETPKKRLTGEYREEQERRRQSTSQGEDDVYTPSSSDDQTYRETSF